MKLFTQVAGRAVQLALSPLGLELRRRSRRWPPTGNAAAERGKHIAGRDEVVEQFCKQYAFENILDIGCGKGACFPALLATEAQVIGVDLLPPSQVALQVGDRQARYVQGNFLTERPAGTYQAVIASHVVEHMPDTEKFLRAMFASLEPGGAFCLIWSPPKSTIVGGHVHVFNTGLMLYNLVRIGVDCRQVECIECGYSLAIMGKYQPFDPPQLVYDDGDIELLAPYFPFPVEQDFEGNATPGTIRLREAA